MKPVHEQQHSIDKAEVSAGVYDLICKCRKNLGRITDTMAEALREPIERRAYQHLRIGNRFKLNPNKKGNAMYNEGTDTTDEDTDTTTTDDVKSDDTEEAPSFSQGDSVHNAEQAVGAADLGDGVVLDTHDDDTVTVGRYASIERVHASTLRSGPSTQHETDDQ